MKSFECIKRKIIEYKKQNSNNIFVSDEQIEPVAEMFDSSKKLSEFNIENITTEGIGGNGIVFKYISNDEIKCIKCLYNKRKRIIKNKREIFLGEERFKNEIKAMN